MLYLGNDIRKLIDIRLLSFFKGFLFDKKKVLTKVIRQLCGSYLFLSYHLCGFHVFNQQTIT